MLHSFAGATSDGADPRLGICHGCNGNLYGTTAEGGIKSTGCEGGQGPAGCGTIFEIVFRRRNWTETLFTNLPMPTAMDPIRKPDSSKTPWGIFTAPPLHGGTSSEGYGTVYKLAPPPAAVGWRAFSTALPAPAERRWPYSNLILDTAGNLYGTASYGRKTPDSARCLRSRREPAILNSAA